MKSSSVVLVLVTLYGSHVLSAAEPPPPKDAAVFIRSTYYVCTNKIEAADRAFDLLVKPELERLVKEQKISSALYLEKDTGERWVRAQSLTGSSVDALLAASAAVTTFSDSKPPKQLYDEACGFGEDYVWKILTGSDQATRGPVALSTYYVCDQTREPEADALMKRIIGPTLDRLVKEGKLKSWFWAEHIFGGKFRRLASMSAADRSALLRARDEFVEASEHDPLANGLRAICGSHDDYIWNVRFAL